MTQNIPVRSVTGLAAGQTIAVGTGATQETATIASVGTPSASTTLAAATIAGQANIKLTSVTNLTPGDTLTIDTGTSLETRTIAAGGVGTAGATGTGVTLTTGLTLAHTSGRTVADNGTGLTLNGQLTLAHASGSAVAQVTPAGSSILDLVSTSGMSPGDTLFLDNPLTGQSPNAAGVWGPNTETVTVAQVNSPTQVTLSQPTQLAHMGASPSRTCRTRATSCSTTTPDWLTGHR